MPLQDHFQPPLRLRRHWHSSYNAWATYISSDLNTRLPEGYFAEANVQFGIEIDVATFEELGPPVARRSSPAAVWTAPPPTLTVPLPVITDIVEVLVFNQEAGPTLAGAIELVSPANKDRPAHRDAFVSKCAAYVQQGIGLAVVDVVTDRRANLHDQLLERLGVEGATPFQADLYAAAYHPVSRAHQPNLDIWQEPLRVGGPLPTMPLWLLGGPCVPVDLETTYDRTCREQRIGAG